MSNTIRSTAEALIESARNNFGQGCNLVPIELEKFRHLNLDAYRRFREVIEKRQFRWLGDLEFTQMSQAPDSLEAPTAISCFVCPEAVMVARMYQTAPNKANILRHGLKRMKGGRWLEAKALLQQAWAVRDHYEFSTEFNDGTWLVTRLDSPAKLIDCPPKFEQAFFAAETGPATLLRHHRDRVRSRIRDGHVQPVRVWSIGEVIEAAKRADSQMWKHRLQQGFYSRAELIALANGGEQQAEALQNEIRAIMLEDPELAHLLGNSHLSNSLLANEPAAFQMPAKVTEREEMLA